MCRSIVEAMLEAANWAPTHGKTEPWRFVVLGRAAQEELLDLSLKAGPLRSDAKTTPHSWAHLIGD